MKKSLNISGYIIPILVAIFNVLILLFPKDIIDAAKDGISLWFNNVFPSLLPFVIGTNILTGLGVTSFIGTLLEPIMYPLFRVPGASGFALAVGMTSGYPMGAKITADLKTSGILTPDEAQRLASFCNNSGPLFILGVIGISMFKNTTAGYFILLTHYTAAITTGLIFKYYKSSSNEHRVYKKRILTAAIKSMIDAQRKDNRTFGTLLGDSVKNSMETILMVGGFIILFCVIVKMLEVIGITDTAVHYTYSALRNLKISDGIIKGIFVGFIEMTNGSKILSGNGFSKLALILAGGIVSFGGLSVTAQSASFFSKAGIKVSVYILSKLLHALITILYGFILYPLFDFDSYVPASNIYDGFLDKMFYSSLYFGMLMLAVLMLILFLALYKKIKKKARF